jgi:hypothetical protein
VALRNCHASRLELARHVVIGQAQFRRNCKALPEFPKLADSEKDRGENRITSGDRPDKRFPEKLKGKY